MIDVTDQCTFNPSHGSAVSSSGTLTVTYNDGEKDITNTIQINSYPRSTFNSPYNISDRITSCANMFKSCSNFSQPITIPDSVTNCDNMFNYCLNFNQTVIIGNSVDKTNNMFAHCIGLNQKDIIIKKAFSRGENMFFDCNGRINVIYESKTIYPEAFLNLFGESYYSTMYSRRNIIFNNGPYSVEKTTQVLNNLFNKTITFSKDVTNQCFYNTDKNIYVYGLNLTEVEWVLKSLHFDNPPQLNYASNMPFDFGDASLYAILNDGSTNRRVDFDYNDPLLTVSPMHTSNVSNIGNTSTTIQDLTVSYTLNGITKTATDNIYVYGNNLWTGQDYNISNNFTDCSYLFDNRQYYSGIVTFGKNITNCYCMFRNCYNYSPSFIDNIPDKVTDCGGMFLNCRNFDTTVNIGNNVINCSYMFKGCSSFNSKVNFKENITDYTGAFIDCLSYDRRTKIGYEFSEKTIIINELFRGCNSLNSEISIYAKNIASCKNAFRGCINFSNGIHIECERLLDSSNMFNNCYFNRLHIFGKEYGNKEYLNLESMVKEIYPVYTYDAKRLQITLSANYGICNFNVYHMLSDYNDTHYDIYVNNFHNLINVNEIFTSLPVSNQSLVYEQGQDDYGYVSYNDNSLIFGDNGGIFIHWLGY